MTLLPAEDWTIRGVPGPKYKVGPLCCVPRCRKPADHAHHMWPRSYLRKQPQDWVEVPDGTVFQNKVALCYEHHEEVTGRIGGHKAAIQYFPAAKGYAHGTFWWCSVKPGNGAIDYGLINLLDPQPPTGDSPVASPAKSRSDVCPHCGQRKPAPRSSSTTAQDGERRRRKTWTVKVPDDAEDGAWVLDTLVDDLAPSLGLHPDRDGRYRSARYYVLVPAVVFAQQHREQFIKEVIE